MLQGEIKISGSKNASLPIMAASLLTDGQLVIKNVPMLNDIDTMFSLLQSLGGKVRREGDSVFIDSSDTKNTTASVNIVNKMRASFLVFGPLLGRFKKAKVGLPGGCSIGTRSINYHLEALAKMGASIKIQGKYVVAQVPEFLQGKEIFLEIPSVGATENIMMAATLAQGRTIIHNAAIEPEVDDLAYCLLAMGANISGIGSRKLTLEGMEKLSGCEHKIIPDRIEAATYAIAAAITGGNIALNNLNVKHLSSVLEVLKKIGVKFEVISNHSIRVRGSLDEIIGTDIATDFYPNIPTDLQSLLTSLLSIAKGNSVIKENIFNNRFGHVPQLKLMGANISTMGNVAYISGTKTLRGARVKATDLRAGAALVIAALAAEGETIIEEVGHIDRGYANLEKKLSLCGADIQRINN